MTGLWLVSYIALWILVLVLGVGFVSVLRNLGTIYETIAPQSNEASIKLVNGEPVPSIMVSTLEGELVPLASLLRGNNVAISVISPGCEPCQEFIRALANDSFVPDIALPEVHQHIIVSTSGDAAIAQLIDEVKLPINIPVLVDVQDNTSEVWGIRSTPTTIIVDADAKLMHYKVGYSSHASEQALLASSH